MRDSDPAVIVAGARTPFGRFMGALSGVTAKQLGTHAITGALTAAEIDPTRVDHVIMGQVLTAGTGQLSSRTAAAAAGVAMTTPSLTINRMCLSGIDAIAIARRLVVSGDADVVVAGGQESMSNAPHPLPASRRGHRYGDAILLDHLAFDGLQDAFTGQSMGLLTDSRNHLYGIGRQAQDEFAARSHQRAERAGKDGLLDAEIVPVAVRRPRAEPVEVSQDEGIRPAATMADLATLNPAFDPGGSITAGNASPISDGACAMVVMRRSTATALGVRWLAEIGSQAVVAGPDSGLHEQPANAIRKACERDGISPSQLDLVEINEAFAAVAIVSIDRLGLDPERVNANGGAIAIGHPIGTSGARITLHLALELGRRGGGVGVAALCGGGGQGQALILRVAS